MVAPAHSTKHGIFFSVEPIEGKQLFDCSLSPNKVQLFFICTSLFIAVACCCCTNVVRTEITLMRMRKKISELINTQTERILLQCLPYQLSNELSRDLWLRKMPKHISNVQDERYTAFEWNGTVTFSICTL